MYLNDYNVLFEKLGNEKINMYKIDQNINCKYA